MADVAINYLFVAIPLTNSAVPLTNSDGYANSLLVKILLEGGNEVMMEED